MSKLKVGVRYSITEKDLSDLIQRYAEEGGRVCIFDDGCLRTGTVILFNEGLPLQNFVSYEVYLNEWSSDQVIKRYKQLPQKWLKKMEDWENGIHQD